jgi:heptosyltransferase-2
MEMPGKIVIRCVNWLGDAVMATPALMRLREHFPQAHIAMLSPAKLQDLWLNHPAINEVIAIAPGANPISVGRQLRAKEIDLALVLPNSPRSALEVWLAEIPERIGYARPWRNWFLTRAVPSRPGHIRMHKRSAAEVRQLISKPAARETIPASAHQVHEYLDLVATLGANPEPVSSTLVVTAEEIETAKREFRLAERSDGHSFFGINAGAEYGPAKRWPANNFISAALKIRERVPCNWVLFGGLADMSLASEIERGIGGDVINLAGRTTLRELMATLKLCRVLLTNDTGPMHLAAAVGTPVVVPFGSTSPELTGPGLPGDSRHRLLKSDAPCSPCFLRECPIDFRCMHGITVERVVDAVISATQ